MTNETCPQRRFQPGLVKKTTNQAFSCLLAQPTIFLPAITAIPRVRFIYEPRTGKRHALLTSRQGGSFGETASPRWSKEHSSARRARVHHGGRARRRKRRDESNESGEERDRERERGRKRATSRNRNVGNRCEEIERGRNEEKEGGGKKWRRLTFPTGYPLQHSLLTD